jgi:DNA primase
LETFTPSEIATFYAARVPGLRRAGGALRGACPIHGGTRESLSIEAATGLCHCHSQCGKGWDVIGFEMALTGVDFITAKASVYATVGRPSIAPRIVAIYDYSDAADTLLYQVVRYDPKDFKQRVLLPSTTVL